VGSIGLKHRHLDDARIRLVAHLGMERETKKRIKSALRYPTMVVVAIRVAMVVITMFVIPSFSSVFNKLGADLTFATKLLMVPSGFMQHYWHVLLTFLIVFWFFFRCYIVSHDGDLCVVLQTAKISVGLFYFGAYCPSAFFTFIRHDAESGCAHP